MKYLVRQYAPAFCTGFDLSVVEVESKEEIIDVPWANRFKSVGFTEFKIEDYGNDELIVSAHYEDGKQWVVSFACELGSKLCKDWRYNIKGYQS